MYPGALNRFSINTYPVKQLKSNCKILSPKNYIKTKKYFPKKNSTEAATNFY